MNLQLVTFVCSDCFAKIEEWTNETGRGKVESVYGVKLCKVLTFGSTFFLSEKIVREMIKFIIFGKYVDESNIEAIRREVYGNEQASESDDLEKQWLEEYQNELYWELFDEKDEEKENS